MPRVPLITRRTLLAATAASLASAALTLGVQNAAAETTLPPELVLAGAAEDYVGYVRIPRYFPETGHNVDGPFFQYFRQTGGSDVHGFPLTEEYWEPDGPAGTDGRIVQYFQRARLEYPAVPLAKNGAQPLPPDQDEGQGETGEDEGATTDVADS